MMPGGVMLRGLAYVVLLAVLSATTLAACGDDDASPDDEQVTLRVGVAMTPPELASFEEGIAEIRNRHPNWTIEIEQTPQSGIIEKMNAQIAGGNLPDVVSVQGLMAHQWIRQGVFEDLSELSGREDFSVDDFWSGALDQFRWEERLYGVPNTVAPDVLFYDKAKFDAAGVAYPTDDWTFDDLRAAAISLTLDAQGNTPADPDFDPDNIVQWGFNAPPSHLWARSYLLPFGADPCVNEDCTEVRFSSPAVIDAMQWWTDLVLVNHAAPYDPYSGNQTGVPGDPFAAGLAAMGFNGFFLVGQLNATGAMDYDVIEPPLGPAGVRAAPLSTTGWAIPTTSQHKDAAWELLTELTSPEFLTDYWAMPGHAVPARRSAADSIINDAPPENQQAILAALEYGEVFRPFTGSAFEAYGATVEIFTAVLNGGMSVPEGMAAIDEAANAILARDRE